MTKFLLCAAWFVNLYGWWRESEKIFVAMEYLGRGDLARYAPSGIPDIEIKEIAENVLRGLEVMHREGFTHRDIKPQVSEPLSQIVSYISRTYLSTKKDQNFDVGGSRSLISVSANRSPLDLELHFIRL